MSQQPPAQPGRAPAPSPPAKGSGHAAAAPAAERGRTRSPGHGHGSHVAEPCPSPPELQAGAGSGIRPHPHGRVGCDHRRGPRSGAVPGTRQLRDARGAPGGSWQRLLAELKRPEAGGEKGGVPRVPPAARTPRPLPQQGERGSLLQGGPGEHREGPWEDSVPHRGVGVGSDPAGAARDIRARVPLGKCVTRTREGLHTHPRLPRLWGSGGETEARGGDGSGGGGRGSQIPALQRRWDPAPLPLTSKSASPRSQRKTTPSPSFPSLKPCPEKQP